MYGLRIQQSRVSLDVSWYPVDSRLVTIDEQGMLLVSYHCCQSSLRMDT